MSERDEEALWRYFREVKQAVEAGNRGDASQPYAGGTFMVSAVTTDLELSIKDISEEDAILIASELKEYGVKAVVSASTLCDNCGERVPEQDYCTVCRTKLSSADQV